MKKRKASKTSVLLNNGGSQQHASPNVVTENGCFTFPNGDRYEGEYEIHGEHLVLFRQGEDRVERPEVLAESSAVKKKHCYYLGGRGVYDTDDFDKYDCVWVTDKIGADLHIRHNDGTEYEGSLDENGTMSGQGTYSFPDGSSIAAEWKKNTLFRNIRYKEPLGYNWEGKLSEDGKEVEFMAGNHFWDDMDVSGNGKSEAQAPI